MTTRRILVVDDDPLQVETLGDILGLYGWDVRGAYSGAEAIEASERESYPVVLMDIQMAGMSGIAAFKAIKERRPDVKVFLMTAFSDPSLIREARCIGAVQVLSKPVEVASLVSALNEQV